MFFRTFFSFWILLNLLVCVLSVPFLAFLKSLDSHFSNRFCIAIPLRTGGQDVFAVADLRRGRGSEGVGGGAFRFGDQAGGGGV